MNLQELSTLSKKLRIDILKMVYTAQSGHPGGSLSIIDILTTIYFGGFLNYDAKNPNWAERDYFIMSKGHASPALYSVLSEAGFFSKDEHFTFRQVNSLLQGHPTKKTLGVEVSTGSLGQGLSIANGIALGKRDKKVFCILGDGESQEGQIWEAAMSSSHYKLGNLIAILDKNELQIDGKTSDVMCIGCIGTKFKSFGWEVFEIDGHNFKQINDALEKAIKIKDRPSIIVAKTVKGKGVSFMEGNYGWHGKAPNEDELAKAIAEINEQ